MPHFDEIFAVSLFEFFERHLSPGGYLIFSSHGASVWEAIGEGRKTYGLREEAITRLVRPYAQLGYGYSNYPGQAEDGISVVSAEWMRDQLR